MEGFPVQEEQQDQGQMESVLVKLQLELQQQLQPAAQSDTAGGDPSPQRLLVARLAPTAAAQDDDVILERDDATAQEAAAATDSMHSEITLRQSSGSLASLTGATDSPAATAADASAADAVADALTHSIASLTPLSPAAAAAAIEDSATESPAATAEDTTPAAATAAAVTPPTLSPLSHSRLGSERCLSVTDDEWHMVSRGSSVKAASSSGRYSFEDPAAAMAAAAVAAGSRGATPGATTGVTTPLGLSGAVSPFESGLTDAESECGSDVTPRDELAASILGHPVMMAAAAAATAASSSSASPLRPASPAAAEGADATAAAIAATGDTEAAAGSSDEAAAVSEEAEVLLDAQEAIGLLGGGLLSLAGGLREWIVESLAALVQTGRDSQSRAASVLRAVQLSAKESGGLAAAAAAAAGDWRLLLSSAAAVVCLALYMKSRKEANVLRMMLRRRDHELSKLVMRVVSLQELINQGGHLQPSISRFTRFEGATVSATYM